MTIGEVAEETGQTYHGVRATLAKFKKAGWLLREGAKTGGPGTFVTWKAGPLAKARVREVRG